MARNPKINKKNEFDVLMDLGFEMEVPEGDSANYADSTIKDEIELQEDGPDRPTIAEVIEGAPDTPTDINDPEEPVPGESEWSQRNRLPAEEHVESEKEDLFLTLHDRLLFHPLASRMKLERYVRRLKLINF